MKLDKLEKDISRLMVITTVMPPHQELQAWKDFILEEKREVKRLIKRHIELLKMAENFEAGIDGYTYEEQKELNQINEQLKELE